jgi:hypothetical protein
MQARPLTRTVQRRAAEMAADVDVEKTAQARALKTFFFFPVETFSIFRSTPSLFLSLAI